MKFGYWSMKRYLLTAEMTKNAFKPMMSFREVMIGEKVKHEQRQKLGQK